MPDWTAPFHLPQFTDEEFTKMRNKYVAKYGYTIHLPGLDEIIIIDTFKPMTLEETTNWKKRKYSWFSEERYNEIKARKNKKKERFLGMLASPTPDIVKNIGSIMTALDDAQDALTTIAVLGRILIRILPSLFSKMLLGPVGWILTAATILDFGMVATKLIRPSMSGKRALNLLEANNPLSNKGKARITRRVLTAMPSTSDIIQVLQTTGSVFGYGLMLGPIIGLAEDLLAGFVRRAMGQEVHFDIPEGALLNWMGETLNAIGAVGYALSNPFQTDEPMLTELIITAYLAHQVAAPILKQWHPIDNVPNLEELHFMAPIPKDILTIEIIEEHGLDVLSTCGWPHNKEMWTTIMPFVDYGKEIATQNLYHMIELNKDNHRGQLIGYLGNQIAFQSLANLVGEENVIYDHTAASKVANAMLHAGLQFSGSTPPEKAVLLTDWLEEMDAIEDSPSLKEVILYCRNNGISLVPYGSENEGSFV